MARIDRDRIQRAAADMLAAIGEEPDRPGLERTPERVAELYAELFHGIGEDPLECLGEGIPLEEADSGDVVIVRDIAFRSVCEHHLLPFTGTAHVAYLPGERVVGLGRIPRVIDVLSSRPQVQERLGEQIVDALQTGLRARGSVAVLDAVHTCVTARGTRQAASSTVTVASRGELAEPNRRGEILTLIGTGADE